MDNAHGAGGLVVPLIWSDADKARLVGYVDKWRGLMLMNGWHINVEFSDAAAPDSELPNGVDEDCAAQMGVNGAYLSGHKVTIYPKMLQDPDHDEQERKIIHELAHIITDGQKRLTRRLFSDKFVTWNETCDANERATDWIANILWAMYDSNGRAGAGVQPDGHPV